MKQRYSDDIYNQRVEAINTVMKVSGANEATKLFTSNIYYLNKQFNTGTSKLNNYLRGKGYNYKINKVMLSYLHTGKRSHLNFSYIYIYAMYFNNVFNLGLKPFELVTYNFELMGLYVNPLYKLNKRYNRVKRIV